MCVSHIILFNFSAGFLLLVLVFVLCGLGVRSFDRYCFAVHFCKIFVVFQYLACLLLYNGLVALIIHLFFCAFLIFQG